MHFTLRQLGLVDTPPEMEFDNLTSLAAELLRVPVAHVSILDREKRRVFYKSQHGHPDELASNRELPMELTYCQHVALNQEPVIVADASVHPLLKDTYALSEGQPLAYLGLPVCAPDGEVIGGLCMMQPDIRQWSESEIKSAKKLAACVSDLIRLKVAMLTSEGLRKEQRQFTYAISHDLISPTNTLLLILNEIEYCALDIGVDILDFVGTGKSIINRMKNQVEDVLAYSRSVNTIDSFEPVSLGHLIEEIMFELKADIDTSSANIIFDKLPEVVGNRMQLKALFQNIIGNALKYRVPCQHPIVTITCTQEPNCDYKIMVEDNGIGIAAKNKESIFNLFTRLHVQEEYAGTGIGLALCHRVAENHGGDISVESDGKSGSTFIVRLPGR